MHRGEGAGASPKAGGFNPARNGCLSTLARGSTSTSGFFVRGVIARRCGPRRSPMPAPIALAFVGSGPRRGHPLGGGGATASRPSRLAAAAIYAIVGTPIRWPRGSGITLVAGDSTFAQRLASWATKITPRPLGSACVQGVSQRAVSLARRFCRTWDPSTGRPALIAQGTRSRPENGAATGEAEIHAGPAGPPHPAMVRLTNG